MKAEQIAKALIVVASAFAASTTAAQQVAFMCGGLMTVYNPDAQQGNIPSAASHLDFDRKTLTTPIGTFDVINVSDTSVHLRSAGTNAQGARLISNGSLDRITGRLSVMWWLAAYGPTLPVGATASMHAELICRPTQRLF